MDDRVPLSGLPADRPSSQFPSAVVIVEELGLW